MHEFTGEWQFATMGGNCGITLLSSILLIVSILNISYHAYTCLFIFYNVIILIKYCLNYGQLPTVLYKEMIKLHFEST